jgi:hypothetical protein
MCISIVYAPTRAQVERYVSRMSRRQEKPIMADLPNEEPLASPHQLLTSKTTVIVATVALEIDRQAGYTPCHPLRTSKLAPGNYYQQVDERVDGLQPKRHVHVRAVGSL